jgi:hypothetical protein
MPEPTGRGVLRAANVIVGVLLALTLTLGTQVAGAGASAASSRVQARQRLGLPVGQDGDR